MGDAWPFMGRIYEWASADPSSCKKLQVLLDKDRPMTFLSWAQECFVNEFWSCEAREAFFMDQSLFENISRKSLSARPLHLAALLGCSTACAELITDGSDPNHLSEFGSPLHCAILGNFNIFEEPRNLVQRHVRIVADCAVETARTLLAAGANPNQDWPSPIRSDQKFSVIGLCILTAQNLLFDVYRAGARLSSADIQLLGDFKSRPYEKEYPHNLKKFIDVVKADYPDDLALQGLENSVIPRSPRQNESENGPISDENIFKEDLVSAVEYGQTATVRGLLTEDSAASFQSVKNAWSRRLLSAAMEHGHDDVLRVLLDEGFDPNQVDLNGTSALHVSSRLGAKASFQILLNAGGDLSVANQAGLTAYHTAAEGGNVELLDLLANQHADENKLKSCRSRIGSTPLHCAAEAGRVEAVKYLLDLAGSALLYDNDVRSVLHYAVVGWTKGGWPQYPQVIGLLTAHGYSPTESDKTGSSPLSEILGRVETARYQGAGNIVRLLANDRACRRSYLQELIDYVSEARLAENSDDEWRDLLCTLCDDVFQDVDINREGLAEAGVCSVPEASYFPNIYSKWTMLLETACGLNSKGTVQYILSHRSRFKARHDFREKKESTPLIVAARQGHTEICDMLFGAGADIDARNVHLRTPLMEACAWGRSDVVELLLEHGSDPTVVDKLGWSVAHHACAGQNVAILKLLEGRPIDWLAKAPYVEDEEDEEDELTPVHVAILAGSIECLRYLLENRPDDFHYFTKRGLCSLALAAHWDKNDSLSVMIEVGAHVNASCIGIFNAMTAFDVAVLKQHTFAVKLLLGTAVIPSSAISSALRTAKSKGFRSVEQILEEYIESEGGTD